MPSLYGANSEYALHVLLVLAEFPRGTFVPAAVLADFQGISPSLTAKLLTALTRDGVVDAAEGRGGGFALARAPEEIDVQTVIEAVEPRKRLFACRDVRARCAVLTDPPPRWATAGVCGIHASMLRAEAAMRASLRGVSLATLRDGARSVVPAAYVKKGVAWFDERLGPEGARRGS